MENKIQNSILIGEEEKNDNNNNTNTGDIFEQIYNEMKNSLKALKEEESKNKNDENIKEEKEKETKEDKNKIDNNRKKSEDILDFVILEKSPEKNKDTSENDSDKDDF